MQYMQHAQLEQVAEITEQPSQAASLLVPTLQWTVDQATGRPVSRWLLIAPTTPDHG